MSTSFPPRIIFVHQVGHPKIITSEKQSLGLSLDDRLNAWFYVQTAVTDTPGFGGVGLVHQPWDGLITPHGFLHEPDTWAT